MWFFLNQSVTLTMLVKYKTCLAIDSNNVKWKFLISQKRKWLTKQYHVIYELIIHKKIYDILMNGCFIESE